MASGIEDLERLRLQLVENVAKLQRLVKHWRLQEADYEVLKESLSELADDASGDEIREATQDCATELLTTNEIESLIKDKTKTRIPNQIINLIDRRIDYVQQNVKNIEKRLESEQQKLDEANFLEHRDEEGLPLMEITEELDEDDNVISAAIVRPGEAAPKLLDVLTKGGIDGFGEEIGDDLQKNRSGLNVKDTHKDKGVVESSAKASPPRLKQKKSVTFADDLQVHEVAESGASSARKVQFAKAVDISQAQPIEDLVLPENESEEEMALRREMLEYNMRKIGTIVAEIDLDGEEDDTDYDEDEDDEDYEDEDEQEDQFGRTTVQVISEEYREKMLALEKKLNAKALVNVGPNPKELSSNKELISAPVTPELERPKQEKNQEGKQAREVRFAKELDIQGDTEGKLPTTEQPKTEGLVMRPLKDQIIEREPTEITNTSRPPKKLSKFKASRMASGTSNQSSQPDSSGGDKIASNISNTKGSSGVGSEGTLSNTNIATINTTIIERDPVASDIREPDTMEPEIHAAEIRNAYHDARNKLIQRENGFIDQDMEQYEDEYGKPQISRFKAARLARQKLDGTR